MKNKLLPLLLFAPLALLASCNDAEGLLPEQSGEVSLNGDTSQIDTSVSTSLTPKQIAVADFASTNFTIDVLRQGEVTAKEKFDGKYIQLLAKNNETGEWGVQGYYVMTAEGVKAVTYNRDTESYIVFPQTLPYIAENFTIDYITGQFLKESLAEQIEALDEADITYNEGIYHIDEVIFHVDEAKAHAIFNSGVYTGVDHNYEYDIKNLEFTLDESKHLASLHLEAKSWQINSDGDFVTREQYDVTNLNLNSYGTTNFEIPDAVASLS